MDQMDRMEWNLFFRLPLSLGREHLPAAGREPGHEGHPPKHRGLLAAV